MRGQSVAALVIGLGWTALAVFFAVSFSLTYISQGRPPAWGLSLELSLAQWLPWAALTPLVVSVTRRLPLDARLGLALPVHIACGVLVGAGKALLDNATRHWLVGVTPYLLISNVALQMLIYWAVVGCAVVIDRFARNRARASEIEARLSQAQVQLLRTQLQPHFLFNALNAVSELVHEDPEKADRMLNLLSDLLRATLDAGDRQHVRLDEELRLADYYLAIQRIRYGDRLQVETAVATDCQSALVPHFCLQPLIENAIRHGLSKQSRGGTIWIRAASVGGSIIISVEDDGRGLPTHRIEGVGLTNTRARLTLLYGSRARLSLEGRPTGGTAARILVPVIRPDSL